MCANVFYKRVSYSRYSFVRVSLDITCVFLTTIVLAFDSQQYFFAVCGESSYSMLSCMSMGASHGLEHAMDYHTAPNTLDLLHSHQLLFKRFTSSLRRSMIPSFDKKIE
jgi:hypothetical protein